MIPGAYKACPQCGTATDANAAFCSRCGHQFRTTYQPPNQTQFFPAGTLPQGSAAHPQPQYQQPQFQQPLSPYVQPGQPYPHGHGAQANLTGDPSAIPPNPYHSPVVAVLIALLIAPLGAIYNGQVAKGVTLFAVGICFFSILMIINWIICIIALVAWWIAVPLDAYLIGVKRRDRYVRQWEFF